VGGASNDDDVHLFVCLSPRSTRAARANQPLVIMHVWAADTDVFRHTFHVTHSSAVQHSTCSVALLSK